MKSIPAFSPLARPVSRLSAILLVSALLTTACYPPATPAPPPVATTNIVPVVTESISFFEASEPCAERFFVHTLDHETTVPGEAVEQFEANGAGVAINDLDGDDDLDIVLANHAGMNTILLNQGNLEFETLTLPHGDSRAVYIVDVDGDGLQDIVFTRRTGAVNYWRNTGQPGKERFQQEVLPGIAALAYAMNWGDLDGDNDLDLVTGSYDASLLVDLGNDFLLGGGGGVTVHENRDGAFRPRSLSEQSQAMSIILFDVDNDGLKDIVVGNDFSVQDQIWLNDRGDWRAVIPFASTTRSTMSLDAGDINNDGLLDLFATDMMPYSDDPATMAAWEPIMHDMDHEMDPDDPQVMRNVLQINQGGDFQEDAEARGVEATGWSWSSKFADLDQDGWLDLYIVNGMIEAGLFSHLPDHELVESDQVFRNLGMGQFQAEPGWNLGSTGSGRGMSLGDMDGDGDLDAVVNNLRGPAQLFENRLCGGDSLQVDLFWPGSKNSRALGSTIALETSIGLLTREVRAGSGYLSGDPARTHFGIPTDATIPRLTVTWPDGGSSVIDDIAKNELVQITRED
ncbi:MAG: CRTAC1 family protein [Chloroflexota bacterium]|nr:CRTAC1 family protein [Chloroflexota bacterium]